MRKKLYVAGPMTGLPDNNYPAFNKEAARLRSLGYEVENPAENLAPPCESWLGYMRLAIRQMSYCDVVFMLPKWETSKGAVIEHQLAQSLGLEILYSTYESYYET